ncbi:helix-turn-helix domain-containing protein [Kribbella sp. CA-253562]|uniref:helix-turn-helix domain-containing protein n=1 Tax=Kribbella sp. CA-253562 TaxID=3239942 RepID=UPI003D934CDA
MQSLSRALTVLAELNRQDRPYGVTELAGTIGLHKSTVHRILATFCAHGLARRVDDHLYCATDGLSALRRTTAAHPDLLAEAATQLNCLVVLARPLPRTGGTVLEIAAVARPAPAGHPAGASEATGADGATRTASPGDAVPLRASALGRAYLAGLPPAEVEGGAELLDTLRRVREVGFAHNARPVAALPRMVAVPVPDGAGGCAGALGAELAHPASLAEIRRYAPVLHRAAARLGPGQADRRPAPAAAASVRRQGA